MIFKRPPKIKRRIVRPAFFIKIILKIIYRFISVPVPPVPLVVPESICDPLPEVPEFTPLVVPVLEVAVLELGP
jgi:hypothetical protein